MSTWRQAFEAALARRVFATTPVLRELGVTTKRRRVMAFGPQTIAPGETVTLEKRPWSFFQGEKLINTGDVAGLMLTGIYVRNQPQVVAPLQFVSVGAFDRTVLDNEFVMDTCPPGLKISMVVTNTGLLSAVFAISLLGTSLREAY